MKTILRNVIDVMRNVIDVVRNVIFSCGNPTGKLQVELFDLTKYVPVFLCESTKYLKITYEKNGRE